MGNWGGAGEECRKEGRTKGSRKEGGGARVGVDARTSGRRLCGVSLGPLSSYPVMLCSVGQVLSSYASHQRIRWETEKTKKGKKWDILIPGSKRENRILKDADRPALGRTPRERAMGSKPSWKSRVGFNRHICHMLTQLTKQCQRCFRDKHRDGLYWIPNCRPLPKGLFYLTRDKTFTSSNTTPD